MTWYDFLLFVHISMAVIWVGGSTIMQFFGLRAIHASDPMRLVEVGQDIEWIGSRVLLPTSAIAVLSGVLMVIDSDFWGFGDDWILLGILLFAITFLAGALFFGPESGRLGRLIASEGPTSAAVQAKLQRLLALTRADLMLLFLIVFDMAVKPQWGDASLWIAVLAFAALAVLLVRNGMNARLGAVAASAAE
ncbi:MAG TPA: DUF2269 family protein [Gaiellaceae bacterium]|nr:DUF2269 family protein [Gaiellaceae bacterium]